MKKKIIFLGSSVTFGAASNGISFVELLAQKDGIIPIKEAVSGTTLVDNGKSSYISRMKTIDKSIDADAFVCQLSTNDATLKMPVGEVSPSFEIEDFDTSTVAGAIEYIIAYAKQTWGCPVIFYTGTRYDSEQYAALVKLLLNIKEKWNIGVIDLWNNEMNNISPSLYKKYMADGIHPTRAGYEQWWLPEFEKYLCELFGL
ncbi:MAG: GDSL-type esterase/lipase family protein [Clostridia bacterium]|nr:GDSL-type esterase/lipase family protein [Clostridia bacterium]